MTKGTYLSIRLLLLREYRFDSTWTVYRFQQLLTSTSYRFQQLLASTSYRFQQLSNIIHVISISQTFDILFNPFNFKVCIEILLTAYHTFSIITLGEFHF